MDPLLPLPGLSRSSSKGTPTSSSTSSSRSSTSSVSTSSSSSVSLSSSTLSTSSTTSSIESSSSSSLTPPSIIHTTTYVVESSPIPPPAANASSNTSFLQNKVASGFVFAVVAIFGLVFISFIATFFIRRRRNRRLTEEAVSFDPVTVGHVDLEKAKQSSSLGHGSHDTKSPMYSNHYSPPHYGAGFPPAGYNSHSGSQFYAPPQGYASPPLSPLPMQQQQYQHQQRHLSYISAMSSAEDPNNHSGPTSGAPVGPVGGQVPEDIRRQYSQ